MFLVGGTKEHGAKLQCEVSRIAESYFIGVFVPKTGRPRALIVSLPATNRAVLLTKVPT